MVYLFVLISCRCADIKIYIKEHLQIIKECNYRNENAMIELKKFIIQSGPQERISFKLTCKFN